MGIAVTSRPRRVKTYLTGRGGVLAMFAACFAGLLVADATRWEEIADATFFLASSLTAYHVRPGSLLPVVASPPLLFLMACIVVSALTSSGPLATLEGVVVALADAAWWMLAGMALTMTIALLRGLRTEVHFFLGDKHQSPRPPARAGRAP
jgi:hypothetical protein